MAPRPITGARILAGVVLAISAIAIPSPAAAECPSVPSQHDPAIIQTVYDVGVSRSVTDKVLLAAFETGWVESHMNNLACGDKDSLGVFQQRSSQGWGTPAQIMDPVYSSNKFYDLAIAMDLQYPNDSAGGIAQRVQRSGHPTRYDENEGKARELLALVTGVRGPSPNPAFAYGNGERHYFGRNISGNLAHSWTNPAVGHPEADVWAGSAVTGDPVTFTHGVEQHVFARTPQNDLAHWVWYPGVPNNMPVLDGWGATGRVTSDPAGFSYGDQQHVFYRAPDGSLEHRWWDASEWQVSHDTWPGPTITGNPVAYTFGTEQHVFARTPEGKLAHWVWYPGIPNDLPIADDWGTTAGQVVSDLAGFSYGDQQHIFFRTAAGTIAHRYWDASERRIVNDGDWAGATVTGNPVAYGHGKEYHVFARGTDNSLKHWVWYPGVANNRPVLDEWSAAGTVAGDPAGFATGDQQHVFFRSADGTLATRFWDASDRRVYAENWSGQYAG
ncbi:hypothetical protein [Actinoplanes sp. NPDC089786]|uniref:hypothetical protein n=1 Tax=Actinoplanes sp. NPDC089786 TaxID=3155185 RepID=UPI003436AF66